MKQQLKILIQESKNIQSQIATLHNNIVQLNQKHGYDKPLIDSEGFPRADLQFESLSAYRLLKKKYNELNNDHKALMRQIEEKMYALHQHSKLTAAPLIQQYDQAVKEKRMVQIQEECQKTVIKIQNSIDQVFAVINFVLPNSSAQLAGFRDGDLLVRIGDICKSNCDYLRAIPKYLHSKRGESLQFQIIRSNQKLRGKIVVQSSLGCRLSRFQN